MKKIIPYTTFHEAIEALDNGGSVIDLFSHAHDGNITSAELAKVARASHDRQAMILYLMMSISKLDNHSRERILAHLDKELFDWYEKYRPIHLSLDQMLQLGKPFTSCTLVGTPTKISSSTSLGGTVMVPVVVEAVTSFTMVPIENSYEVYELHSKESDAVVMVAHDNEKESLPERNLRIGGVLTSLNPFGEGDQAQKVFLKVQYYMEED